jgi:lantibiotic modifying enzyme
VEAIAADLRADDLAVRDYTFAGGLGGVALCLAQWAALSGSEPDRAAALRHLERAWLMAEEQPMSLGLFAGLTGLVAASRAVSQLLGVHGLPDGVEEIDDAVEEALATEGWTWQYDLTYGLVGLGTYAALHPDPEMARSLGRLAVEKLASLAVEDEGGLRWRTPPEYRPLTRRESLPAEYCDLGVAHGVAGVSGMLARLDGIVATRTCRRLLDGAVSFLLRQQRDVAGFSRLPAFAPSNGEDCRSAWCYGDVGIGTVLVGTGQRLGDPALAQEGEELLLHDAERPWEGRQVGDCSICHGGAGIAHLYARAYSRTGNAALRSEALRWYRWSLDRRHEGVGVGGYLGWVSERSTYEPFPGLLVGSAGIGLALASALDPREPSWDRLLLVD